MSDIPVSFITDVSVRMIVDKTTLTVGFVLLASAVACKFYIASQIASWALSIPVLLFALFGILGCYIPMLRIVTRGGELTFEVSDPKEDALAFAMALRQRVESRGA